MTRAFFIAGPTATGKSNLAAELACELGAEVVSADAFQGYRGLDLLSAKPDAATLAKAPHHLIGTIPLSEEMNAEKFRRAASRALDEIYSRGKLAIVVGGTGLYIKALTHGLAPLPSADPKLREKLNAMSLDDLRSELAKLDPEAAKNIDTKNRRRLVRSLEICLLTGEPASAKRQQWGARASSMHSACTPDGFFVLRDREELYERINQRVESMFKCGVIEEVRAAGVTSATASQMIGLRGIRELLAGKKSRPQCIAEIQQSTRRYAKRQLTWFRRQTNFSPLNLSFLTHNEAVKRISLRMLSGAGTKDD
jgi:tRNA dimethylallyltransferase